MACDLGGAEGIRTPDPLDANEVRYRAAPQPLEPLTRLTGGRRRQRTRSREATGRAGENPVPRERTTGTTPSSLRTRARARVSEERAAGVVLAVVATDAGRLPPERCGRPRSAEVVTADAARLPLGRPTVVLAAYGGLLGGDPGPAARARRGGRSTTPGGAGTTRSASSTVNGTEKPIQKPGPDQDDPGQLDEVEQDQGDEHPAARCSAVGTGRRRRGGARRRGRPCVADCGPADRQRADPTRGATRGGARPAATETGYRRGLASRYRAG